MSSKLPSGPVPEKVNTLVVPDLGPEVYEICRLYTDPTLPTFGNKSASAAALGKQVSIFDRKDVQAEIDRINLARAEAGQDVAQFMSAYVWDAARLLIQQLSLGADLKIIDPSDLLDNMVSIAEIIEEFGESELPEEKIAAIVEGVVAGKTARANAISKANEVKLKAAKEQRAALELLLRYHLGSPEQRIRVTKEEQGSLPKSLQDLGDEELEIFGGAITEEMAARKPQEVTPEADYTVEDDDEWI